MTQRDFILLDRSGSMFGQWIKAIEAINTYVKELHGSAVDTRVTLAVFDSHRDAHGDLDYHVLRESQTPADWSELSPNELEPRGGTPLNDAILRLTKAAEQAAADRCAVIIMTDGEENQSREDPTGEMAKAALDRCRARGWPVVFLGANYDPSRQAQALGGFHRNTIAAAPEALGATMYMTAQKRGLYGLTGSAATMDYMPEEQEAMKKNAGK